MSDHKEVEVKFLDIDEITLKAKLLELGAEDLGERILYERIFYDPEKKWFQKNKFVRIRGDGVHTKLSYKHFHDEGKDTSAIHDVTEVELEINDINKATAFLELIGLKCARYQEKKRHSFRYKDGEVDFDTWPTVPTFIEIEAQSEAIVKSIAKDLGLSWDDVYLHSAGSVIAGEYGIPFNDFTYFTFEKQE